MRRPRVNLGSPSLVSDPGGRWWGLYDHAEGRQDLLRPEATTERGTCRVRSETDHPCSRPAVVKICGVPFCERCAREQEAYFAVGELTQALAADRTNRTLDFRRAEPVVEMLDRMRWELTRRFVEAGTERTKVAAASSSTTTSTASRRPTSWRSSSGRPSTC